MLDFSESLDTETFDITLDGEHEGSDQAQSEREWTRMSDQFYNAGYREGITSGKENALQGAFDGGFAEIGAPIGRFLGKLRGIASALVTYLKSPGHQIGEIGTANTHLEDVNKLLSTLDSIHFVDIEPPDEEALEHALEHEAVNGASSARLKLDSGARRESLAKLNCVYKELKQLSGELGLGLLFDDPPRRAMNPGQVHLDNILQRAQTNLRGTESLEDNRVVLQHLTQKDQLNTNMLALPDDVLILILEIYYSLTRELRASAKYPIAGKVGNPTETLSLVCRTIRKVVVTAPTLWQDVSLDRDPRHYFERCGGYGFNISIDLRADLRSELQSLPSYMSFSNRRCSRAIQILRLALPNLERCRSISIRATNEYDLDAILEYVERAYAGKSLTSLTRLYLDYGRDIATDGHDYVLESVLDPNSYRKTCFCSWNMPALKTVHAMNVIPLIAAPSVTYFHLELTDDKNRPDHRGLIWGLQTLTLTLGSFVNLKELSIKLSSIKRFHGQDTLAVELAEVRKLRLDFADVHLLAIEKVLGRISTPNATTLDLSLMMGSCNARSGSSFEKLQAIFPKNKCYWPRLEELNLSLLSNPSDIYVHPPSTWEGASPVRETWVLNALTNLPPIKALTLTNLPSLETPKRAVPCGLSRHWSRSPALKFREYGSSNPPPIEILRFQEVSLPLDNFLPSILDILAAPSFKIFEVIRCPYIKLEDVQRLVKAKSGLVFQAA